VRKRHLIALIAICLAMLSPQARPQVEGTELALSARWDDTSAVAGKVTIAAVHAVGADTVLATKVLSNGSASVTLALTSNSMYRVTLTSPAGAHLVKFPFTTLLVNPQNLERGAITLVLHKANNSLKSANVNVTMDF
jgi:hypothetical protein